jgi:ABC-type transporter Mla maintaining outer membrane lipid asymmetry permease subunit MlaE
MISRSTLASALVLLAAFAVNVTALWAVDIVRFVPHLELHQTCNHVGPGALVIIGVMSLVATVLIPLTVRFWFNEPREG